MKRFLLIFALLLAFFLRIISLSEFPSGFNADEASMGYDAYSILHTGRDQWGAFLPLVLKSFGDYKPPLYAYLTVPSVAVLDLNIFATRLPDAVIGTLAVLAVYLLISEVKKFGKWEGESKIGSWKPEIIASFLLAVNPWAVMMSRGAFEANLITFFLPLGVYLFLKGIKESKFIVWSAVFMGMSLFTYHSAKLITPLVLAGLVVVFRKTLLKIGFRKLAASIMIFAVFFGALLITFKIGGGSRITERSISQGALLEGFNEREAELSKGTNPTLAKAFHNKYTVIVNSFKNNYLQYFSTKFLVEKGAGDGTYGMIPGIGVIYIMEFILLLGTVPLIIIEKKSRNVIYLIIAWLMVAPLAGALASGVGYSGNRAEGMLPVLQILEAFGFLGWILLMRKINLFVPKIVTVFFAIVLTIEVINFAGSYFKNPSNSVLQQMLYGNVEVATWLKQNAPGRRVLISRSLSEPQIFIAFVNMWDPVDYQKSTKSWNLSKSGVAWVDQLPDYALGNYAIKSIDWKTDVKTGSLIVARAGEIDSSLIPVKTIRYPDGTPTIYILDTTQKVYAKTI